MALAFYFQPTGFTPSIYDQVAEELENVGAGFGSVPGRTFHCAMDMNGSIAVFDVWESQEKFDEFGQTLLPIMSKLGVEPGEPMVSTIRNLQHG